MNIIVVNYEYPPVGGGGGFVTRDIYECIASQGHRVTVLTSQFDKLASDEIKNGVRIIRVPVLMRKKLETASFPSMVSYIPSSILNGIIRCRKNCIDIVNTHFAIPSGPAGMVISRILGVPNVLTIHGGDIYDPSKKLSPHRHFLLRWVVKTALLLADRVVAQSSDTVHNSRKYYCPGLPAKIIPLGIQPPKLEPADRTQFDLGNEDFVLCSIGRLVKRKNVSDILKVCKRLHNEIRLRLIVIGNGPEYDKLNNLTKAWGLTEYVQFLGNVDDKTKYQALSISDMYVSTALHEGFGLVFLEAMACGLPIACYDKGGHMDFLENGKTGVIAKLGDRDELSDGIRELARKKELSTYIAEFNRVLVKKYYIENCAAQYLSTFKSVLSRRRTCC